jgi:hypothetical protein
VPPLHRKPFIDQLHTLQFALQQNNIPVFSYCSEFFDAYARGRSVIQGQIAINYVHQGYLYAALKQYAKLQPQTAGAADTASQIAQTVQAQKALQKQPSNEQSRALQKVAAERLTQLLRSASADDVQRAQSLLRSNSANYDPYTNPLYQHQVFDIRLEIGDGPYKTVRLLESVKLGANEQIIDQSGQTLGEAYEFTARRLR